MGFTGDKLEAYFKENFPENWNKADAKKEGRIEIERGSTLLRAIINDPVLSYGLQ